MAPSTETSSGRPGPAPNPFRQVLVGWDGSPGSVAALRTAAAIVGDGPGRVIALAVLPRAPRLEKEPGQEGSQGASGVHARQSFEAARSAITGSWPVRISLHTGEGRDAARTLCDHATVHGFDLLVIGRHGDGGVLHPKLGHVAEAAARASRIPIMLVGGG